MIVLHFDSRVHAVNSKLVNYLPDPPDARMSHHVHLGNSGRKKSLAPDRIAELCQKVAAGETKTEVARYFGINRETLYSYLAETKNNGVAAT